jgi:hypothetical protein
MSEKIAYKVPTKGRTFSAIQRYIESMQTLKAETLAHPLSDKPLHREFARSLDGQIAQAENLVTLLKL